MPETAGAPLELNGHWPPAEATRFI